MNSVSVILNHFCIHLFIWACLYFWLHLPFFVFVLFLKKYHVLGIVCTGLIWLDWRRIDWDIPWAPTSWQRGFNGWSIPSGGMLRYFACSWFNMWQFYLCLYFRFFFYQFIKVFLSILWNKQPRQLYLL